MQELAKRQQPAVVQPHEPASQDVQQISFAMEMSSGYPPPSMVKAYKEIDPDMPGRLLAMAEAQQSHRFANENKVVDSSIALSRTGQWMGWTLAVGFIFVAWRAVELNQPWVAAIASGTTIVSLVSVFVRVAGAKSAELQSRPHASIAANSRQSKRVPR